MERKGKKQRGMIRLIAVCLVLLCLGGCTMGSKTNEVESNTDLPSMSMMEALADYTIVYPDSGTSGEGAAANLLFKAFGSDLRKLPKSDWVKSGEAIPAGNREILVGQTNRQSSQAAVSKLEKERDWSISVENGEIVIAAKDDTAIVEATEYFIAIVLPASNSLYAPGFSYSHNHTYQLNEFFGMNPESIKIMYTDDRLEDAAALLQDYVLARTGVLVNAEKDSGTVSFRIDTNMSQEQYSVSLAGGGLRISGGSYVAVEEAVKAIVVNEKGSEAVGFTGDSTIPVTMTDLRNREMELVWHDEFDSDTLNPKNWQLNDRMFGGSIVTTTSERNIMLEDGKVIMRSWKEENGTYSTHKTLTSTGRLSFLYGYIEISARFAFKPGCFPSFWFQSAPQHRTADYMTEVDMFEPYFYGYMESAIHMWYLKQRDDGFGSSYAHYWSEPQRYTQDGFEEYWNYWNYQTMPELTAAQKAAIEEFNSTFHTLGFGWTPTEMYFTVDGEEVGRFDISESSTLVWNPQNSNGNPNDEDYKNLIASGKQPSMNGFVNDALFINFTNWIGSDFRYKGYGTPDEDAFPNTFEVDWIRLYQKPGEGALYYDYK